MIKLKMEEDILDIIRKIQEARSPKYFLWQIIKDTEWFDYKYDSDFLIGEKGDIVYFKYNKKKYFLYYNYDEIYTVLETKYHLNVLNANELVSGMVSEHTKMRVDTTIMMITVTKSW
jgi:hypothetical protein